MITGKIIEKAEEEEEDSDVHHDNKDGEYEDDSDFDQYHNVNEECFEVKKAITAKHFRSSLRDKTICKRERCEF
jgi:hypothetical protein